MQIAKHAVVAIDYKLTNNDGEVLDSSEGRDPLRYLHGAGNLIPGLENALEGKSAGDELSVTIPPEEAYGVRDDQLVQDVPRDKFPADQDLQVGMQFQAQTPEGTRVLSIVGVAEDTVTVDANHALAGVTLNFDVSIREVREATEEEVSHGHVHGPGGHHH